MRPPRPLWALLVALLPVFAFAQPLPEPAAEDELVEVADALRQVSWPVPPAAAEALRRRDWTRAADALQRFRIESLSSAQRLDHAFVTAWALVHAGRAVEGLKWMEPIRLGGTAPAPWRALVQAEILRAQGQRAEALSLLEGVGDAGRVGVRASVLRAEVLRELGRTADAAGVVEALAARPDPAPGGATVLWTLALRKGLGSEESYAPLRRLWTHYPGSEEGKDAATILVERYAGRAPTMSEVVARAAVRAEQGAWAEVLSLTEPFVAAAAEATPEACRLSWLRMRALYRRNELTATVSALGNGGARCAAVPGDNGAKMLYLAGEALFRKGSYQEAALTYAAIALLAPESSMADDGLTRSGIAWSEAGDRTKAMKAWEDALDRFPRGDTVPEAGFRLAFAHYDEGHADRARTIALRLGALDPRLDEVHVPAGRYWAARWLVHPDVGNPNQAVVDGAARAQALSEWISLLAERPHGYYAALAWARVHELDPAAAQRLAARGPQPEEPRSWLVRQVFLDRTEVEEGVALARLGLVADALDAWAEVDLDRLRADEVAWLVELRTAAGDWLEAHARMHRWLRTHPVGTLGANERAIVRLAYPNRYAEEIRAATATYAWPARVFHALVREESLFNARVVSHAGAKGLAQLMPGTARDTARKLGVTLAEGDLFEPAVNTRLGAAYFDQVLRYVGGNPCLAMAAYNAGPGRVDEWTAARGNLPLDEWVERIPFRETRGYVKRVTSTWQTMHHVIDVDKPAFIDLSAFSRAVKPAAGVP